MREMREFECAVVSKIIFYGNEIEKVNIKVENYEYTWSDCEVYDKISFIFIVHSGIFDLPGGL